MIETSGEGNSRGMCAEDDKKEPFNIQAACERTKTSLICSLALVGVLALLLSGCGSSSSEANGESGSSIEVSKSTWHNGPWPFTVERGILGCHTPPYPGAVTFNVEGTTYGVNGDATGYPEINPIWLHAPSGEGGPRVSIGGMIEEGLKLCEEKSG